VEVREGEGGAKGWTGGGQDEGARGVGGWKHGGDIRRGEGVERKKIEIFLSSSVEVETDLKKKK